MKKNTVLETCNEPIILHVQETDDGTRIDSFLHQQIPHYSRTFFKQLLKNKNIRCNDTYVTKASTPVMVGDKVSVIIPPQTQKDLATITQDLQQYPVELIAETDDFLVLNKPAGLLVHNTTSDPISTTLVDWIDIHRPTISKVGEPGRPGIVHRLDRNTSGIILIAKTDDAYQKLMQLFKDRTIKKTYSALVKGHPDRQGTINFPIGRHPHQRHKMTAYKHTIPPEVRTREAESDYSVLEYFPETTYINIFLKTGRTHQIRVHLSAIGHPIIGDHIYGASSPYITRQALHAESIMFELDGVSYRFICPPPKDFLSTIDALK